MAFRRKYHDKSTSPLDTRPSSISVEFDGTPINLSAIARSQFISIPQVSRIFNGIRPATLTTAMKISASLGMGLEEFLGKLEIHVEAIREREAKAKEGLLNRVHQENLADLNAFRRGKVAAPRLPGLRPKVLS